MATAINRPTNKDLKKTFVLQQNLSLNFPFALALGKEKVDINSELYADTSPLDTTDLTHTNLGIVDLVRARSGNFWCSGSVMPKFHNIPGNDIAFDIEVIDTPTPIKSNEIFGKTIEHITITANKSLFTFNPGDPLQKTTNYNENYWSAFASDKIINTFNVSSVPTFQLSKSDISGVLALAPFDFILSKNTVASSYFSHSQLTKYYNLLNSLTLNTIFDSVKEVQTDGKFNYQDIAKKLTDSAQAALTSTQVVDNNHFQEIFINSFTSASIASSVVTPFKPLIYQNFQNVIATFDEGKIFNDHVFKLNIPFTKKELGNLGHPIGSLVFDVKPNYNFLISNYETVINNQEARETLLPNMYAFLSEYHEDPSLDKSSIWRQHITLNGNIPNVFVDVTNNRGEKTGVNDIGEYFDEYAKIFQTLIKNNTSEQDSLSIKFTNLVAPVSNIDLFKNFNNKANLFPMFFDISFSTDNYTQFAQIFEDSQLTSFLIKDIIEGNLATGTLNFQETTFETIEQNASSAAQSFVVSNNKKSLRTWDMIEWVNQISRNPINEFSGLESGVFLGALNDEVQLTNNSQYEFIKNLLIIIFAGKFKQLITKNSRSYKDIIQSKPAYSENLFYRIEKSDTRTGKIIQNFYLPNTKLVNTMRFIDTQVKYNKQYTYTTYVYQIVLGNKYYYSLTSVGDNTADAVVFNTPSVKLIETVFNTFTGRIMDNPPVFPDIDVIPYRAVNNQILFNMNSGIGSYTMKPIILEPGDVALINQLREAQQVDANAFLEYSSNDSAKAFEIFRIDTLPKSYQDFAGNRIALVETDIPSNFAVQSVTAGSFVDTILPNKKYYYTFRTIDTHGHISNPTPVFQLELVDDDGTIYPLIQTVEFDSYEGIKSITKTAKRFIQLIPSFNQSILNEQKSGLIQNGVRVDSVVDKNNFYLGVTDEPVWGKNFKVRFTSKKTGKKIDLNLQFIHTFINKQ